MTEGPWTAHIEELGLTSRELEVLYVVLLGERSLSAIARALDPPISPRTAEAHVYNIAEKLPAEFEPSVSPFWRVVMYASRSPGGGV